MTEEQFTFWLKGVTDALGNQPPSDQQWKMIKANIGDVFGEPTFQDNSMVLRSESKLGASAA
jgi:hypothetical protein